MAKKRRGPPPSGPQWGWPLGLGAGLFLLDAFLVSPFIGWYDSGEMVGTTACLGISHPSGQALFHLLGKIFFLLPWSTPAWRLGLMSAACSALASALFFILSTRLAEKTSGKPMISGTLKLWLALLTLAWSLSLPWWRYSLVPLVYGLHLALGLLTLWAVSLEKPFKWYLVFLLLGVATVFRPTHFFVLLFAGTAFLASLKWDWKSILRTLPRLFVFFLLGRSTLLYLPLRSALNPPMANADLTHPIALFRHVMALRFSNSVGANSLQNMLHVAGMMLSHFWTDLTPLGVALLLVGLVLALRQRAKMPAFLWVGLGGGLLEALFVFTIPYPTFESHQTLLGWAFGGLLAALALARFEVFLPAKRFPLWRVVASLVLTALALLQLSQVGHLLDRKKERGAEDYARNVLTLMGPNAVYFPAEENEYFPVAGYQQAFGYRPDVQVLEPGTDPALVAPKIRDCLNQGRPLFVTRKWTLPPGWGYSALGPLFQVVPIGGPAPTPALAPKGRPLASWGGLELQGVDLVPSRVTAGGMVKLAYRWVRRKASPQDESDMVVAIFIDRHGSYWAKNGVFWLHDIHEFPAAPKAMRPGALYPQQRVLLIPSDFPPGNYALAVGLQKKTPPREQGQEAFNQEFYERSAAQDLDKFLGQGENGSVVQFSSNTAPWKDGLWPVTKSLYPIADPRFVPVAELQIQPAP